MSSDINSWWGLAGLLIVVIFGPGGVLLAVMARHEKRDQKRTEKSAELHRAAFDGVADQLEARLSAKIDAKVDPIADRQIDHGSKMDALAADVRGLRTDVGELRGADRDLHVRVTQLERTA